MIRPPGWDGVAFSDGGDGDMRHDLPARRRFSDGLGVSEDWAMARQVHGGDVVRVDNGGEAGEADALWTTERGLPVAVFTADCLGVVLRSERAVGVAHCGWRGVIARAPSNLLREMTAAGHRPERAAVGPGIGPCCFEVGSDVLDPLGRYEAETTWGTPSVDLVTAVIEQLAGLETWTADRCTRHVAGLYSHRRDGDTRRMAAIGWVP